MCPGALQGGACHPPATRPGEIDGHPREETRPCLHSVNQVMWFYLKPLQLFQRLHSSGQLFSCGGLASRGQAAPQPEASCSLQKQRPWWPHPLGSLAGMGCSAP